MEKRGQCSKMSHSGELDTEANSGWSPLSEDQSRCAVCEQVLTDPVSITCGHRFCRRCITRHWEQPAPSGHYGCPRCRKRFRTRPVLLQRAEPNDEARGSENMDVSLQRAIVNHKDSLKRRYECVIEGLVKAGSQTSLNRIYTELYITEGESEGLNDEHEMWQLETACRTPTSRDTAIHCNDLFKPLAGQERSIRTVLTKGIAGIGKTVSVQTFILDWAEGKANQDVEIIFVLPFRELNLVKDLQYSLLRLLHDFHPELDIVNAEKLAACKAMFILDGLDESRIPLDFQCNKMMSDVTQTSSVDVLLTNLIRGNLLPSALLWITSRPAATNQIPSECVDQVTEVRGFNDQQKEEYFRKRFRDDEDLANRIIFHIKTSRSLHVMCHMPVFCWISATVLEHMSRTDERREMPKTLTETFTHFVLIHTSPKNQKCPGKDEMDQQELLESDKEALLKLGKLAFEHLEKGNLVFYEEDLKECGIDVKEASVYSGVCTQVFKEESVLFQRVVYCFVHLSVQEFLSAVYVYHCYTTKNMDELKPFLQATRVTSEEITLHELLKSTANKALESKTGHLDLVVRFLHGMSLAANQKLLRGLVTQTESSPESVKKTIRSLKMMQNADMSPERCINLFHCLIEMKTHSVQQEIEKYTRSEKRSKNLPLTYCSALAYMLQISDEVLEAFDLKKYKTSQEGRRRLLPAVRVCRKALLADCQLIEASCELLVSALSSNPSNLRELDMSNNDLNDSGVKLLSAGLGNPHCKLETLKLSGCGVTEEGCAALVSALRSNPNHLRELDLSDNHLGDSMVQHVSPGLEDSFWRLEILSLSGCKLTEASCEVLASALSSSSHLRELDLSNNDLLDSGVKLLFAGRGDSPCKLEILSLSGCKLTEASCEVLASALSSSSHLRELDLSNNDLLDSGVKLLFAGRGDSPCKLEILRLAFCEVTEEGCASLVSALKSNPSHLRELDLSYNHPGDSGVRLLSAGLEDPHCRLEKLKWLCALTGPEHSKQKPLSV
ncbi:NLR family CARD domain-containing protein 3-like isoform X5 [Oncorhynchus mykiss]|uniref:NLR family CARD domain-containing protein 3-like isoform X5 n=1 Tax=Oncorhynchus mykiss TaxID=8022 RepID=UPI0018781A21|nr:NLR family CARD domain-containing protein 3-like isoform X5 [Oncorhynchus mykiss]